MRAQVKNLSAMTHNSVHTAKVVMKQNKFPFQPFSKRVIIILEFLYSLGYRSPTTDTTQTQIFSTDVRIVQFQGPPGAWSSAPRTASLVFLTINAC